MNKRNLILLKSIQSGKFYTNIKYFEWQNDFNKYSRRMNRLESLAKIFNI